MIEPRNLGLLLMVLVAVGVPELVLLVVSFRSTIHSIIFETIITIDIVISVLEIVRT